MRERMLAGDLYIADDPELARESARAQRLTHQLNTMDPTDQDRRRALLIELLGAFGEGSEIRPPLRCDYGYQTFVGRPLLRQLGAGQPGRGHRDDRRRRADRPERATAHATHPLDPGPRRDKWEAAEPIVIGDNVWLGGGVIVCPGVTIGANTVVGAGSVVVRDLPAGVVAVGSPARVVRAL